eukprot:scpid88585/ scgid12827/ 
MEQSIVMKVHCYIVICASLLGYICSMPVFPHQQGQYLRVIRSTASGRMLAFSTARNGSFQASGVRCSKRVMFQFQRHMHGDKELYTIQHRRSGEYLLAADNNTILSTQVISSNTYRNTSVLFNIIRHQSGDVTIGSAQFPGRVLTILQQRGVNTLDLVALDSRDSYDPRAGPGRARSLFAILSKRECKRLCHANTCTSEATSPSTASIKGDRVAVTQQLIPESPAANPTPYDWEQHFLQQALAQAAPKPKSRKENVRRVPMVPWHGSLQLNHSTGEFFIKELAGDKAVSEDHATGISLLDQVLAHVPDRVRNLVRSAKESLILLVFSTHH